jgi:hypothetical protein
MPRKQSLRISQNRFSIQADYLKTHDIELLDWRFVTVHWLTLSVKMNYLNGAGHGCFADGMAVDFF